MNTVPMVMHLWSCTIPIIHHHGVKDHHGEIRMYFIPLYLVNNIPLRSLRNKSRWNTIRCCLIPLKRSQSRKSINFDPSVAPLRVTGVPKKVPLFVGSKYTAI